MKKAEMAERPNKPARPSRGRPSGVKLSWEATPQLRAALEVVHLMVGARGVARLLNSSESFARDLVAGATALRDDMRPVLQWAQLQDAETLRSVELEPAPEPEPEVKPEPEAKAEEKASESAVGLLEPIKAELRQVSLDVLLAAKRFKRAEETVAKNCETVAQNCETVAKIEETVAQNYELLANLRNSIAKSATVYESTLERLEKRIDELGLLFRLSEGAAATAAAPQKPSGGAPDLWAASSAGF